MFVGKGVYASVTVGMAEAYSFSETNKSLFDSYRYFAMAESGEISSSSPVFRPFLLLNDSSTASAARCVSTNPLAYNKVYRNGVEGDVVPEIGFPAYVNKLLGGNIKEPLCRSWGMALDSIESLGYERDLYKFMYDVSDVRLNLSDYKVLNSTEEVSEEEKSFLNLVSESNEDFSNEDSAFSDADNRLSNILDEELEFDLFSDDLNESSFNATNYDSLNDSQYQANIQEIQNLVSRLEQLGVNINSLSMQEAINPNENRTVISESSFIGVPFGYNEEITLGKLMDIFTNSIINEFGGLERFNSFTVKGGSIAVNNSFYRCQISDACRTSIPYDIRREVNAGNVSSLFHYECLKSMPNLRILNIDSKDTFINYIAPALNINSVEELFSVLRNLTSLKIGDKDCTKEEVKAIERELEMTRRANSLAASVEKHCFKGTGATWSFTKNMWNKKNCNKAVKALGVTAGLAGTAITGTAGVGVKVGRTVVHGAKSFVKGLKDLF